MIQPQKENRESVGREGGGIGKKSLSQIGTRDAQSAIEPNTVCRQATQNAIVPTKLNFLTQNNR